MAVADVVDITDITKYVGVNDMLVAANGKCFGSVDTQDMLLSWKHDFATLTFPKLLTFFRFDESGELSFEPRAVFSFYCVNCSIHMVDIIITLDLLLEQV